MATLKIDPANLPYRGEPTKDRRKSFSKGVARIRNRRDAESQYYSQATEERW